MRPLVSPEEMRRADEEAIRQGSSVETLMERAGRAVARAAVEGAGGIYGKRFTVVSGKGNNGGDGFVAARVLHQRGARVVCCTTFDPSEAQGAPAKYLEILRATGCRVVDFEPRHLETDVVIDAILGTGFSGPPRGRAAEALEALVRLEAGRRPLIVSVDVPSAGLVRADATVALAAEKRQTAFGDPQHAGRVQVADIGIPIDDARLWVLDEHDVARDLPRPQPDDHKTSHGSVVVIAGSDVTTGAAVLTARGAARMGAGYVTLVSTREVIRTANIRIPDALKLIAEAPDVLTVDSLDQAQGSLDRADAVAMGPGLGTGEAQGELVRRALRDLDHPLVLDADGLNVLVGQTQELSQREATTVITPHAGEMARLLDKDVKEIVADRPAAAFEAADRFGCIVVLKGRNTLVAGSDLAFVVPSGGPELATSGTGDVLAGAIAASLARGGEPQRSVAAACFAHGVAGARAAAARGAAGLVAWDVAETLPEAIAGLTGP